MRSRILLLCCIASAIGVGCSSASRHITVDPRSAAQILPVTDIARAQETILLVSLDDGQVVMQTITSEADICFKMASDSATTCLVRGAPIVDPATNAVIGIEMVETHIDLIAKTN